MPPDERLQLAISKAKTGHELTARELFVDIVQDDPDNKLAWLWLIGLLDDRKDIIFACKEVLRLDPEEERVRQRLRELEEVENREREIQGKRILEKVRHLFSQENKELALTILRKHLHESPDEEGWALLAKYSPSLDEQVHARTKIRALDPENKDKDTDFQRVRYFRENPFELAASYEERGEIDKALALYDQLIIKAKGRREWDRIFREIHRLEGLQEEEIVHISPALTVARLTAGPPLLFFSMLIIQIGYDHRYFSLLMAAELLLVLLGAFLVGVASAGSEHRLWQQLGNAAGRGSKRLRFAVGIMGTVIMIIPFILLGYEAFMRWPTVFEYFGY